MNLFAKKLAAKRIAIIKRSGESVFIKDKNDFFIVFFCKAHVFKAVYGYFPLISVKQ